jgi:hypothetical protein
VHRSLAFYTICDFCISTLEYIHHKS